MWYNKGVTLEILGRDKEALECFKEASKINPKDSKAWYNYGFILEKKVWKG
nr:tetratricopeptide repeat protein [Methanobacterium formicicum]